MPAPDPSTAAGQQLIHRDNTFGTPEEDAFRRDFTINALFYDIATFSIIDYVGGLDDLRAGDRPLDRRSGSALPRGPGAHAARRRARGAARLHDRSADPRSDPAAPPRDRAQLAGPPARGVLQDPAQRATPRRRSAGSPRRDCSNRSPPSSIAARAIRSGNRWRRSTRTGRASRATPETLDEPGAARQPARAAWLHAGAASAPCRTRRRDRRAAERPAGPRLGELPLARRDVERLSQVLQLQRRLRDVSANQRMQNALAHRSIFREALTWLDVHGGAPALVAHWTTVADERGSSAAPAPDPEAPVDGPPRRRRRRRRRRFRPLPS